MEDQLISSILSRLLQLPNLRCQAILLPQNLTYSPLAEIFPPKKKPPFEPLFSKAVLS